MHINGRKHVLKHGGHEFDLHAIRTKVVKDEQGMVCELLVVHPVFLQRRHHIFDEGILRKVQSLGNRAGPVDDSGWLFGHLSAFTLEASQSIKCERLII